jgi:hypothetical protein
MVLFRAIGRRVSSATLKASEYPVLSIIHYKLLVDMLHRRFHSYILPISSLILFYISYINKTNVNVLVLISIHVLGVHAQEDKNISDDWPKKAQNMSIVQEQRKEVYINIGVGDCYVRTTA